MLAFQLPWRAGLRRILLGWWWSYRDSYWLTRHACRRGLRLILLLHLGLLGNWLLALRVQVQDLVADVWGGKKQYKKKLRNIKILSLIWQGRSQEEISDLTWLVDICDLVTDQRYVCVIFAHLAFQNCLAIFFVNVKHFIVMTVSVLFKSPKTKT